MRLSFGPTSRPRNIRLVFCSTSEPCNSSGKYCSGSSRDQSLYNSRRNGATNPHPDSRGKRSSMAWHAVYRTPADALKEHVSNAIDEHLKARLAGTALTHCHVRFHLDRRHITI